MDIKSIKDDKFLKEMNNKQLKELSSDVRSFLLENISKTGGHLSSNLGDVELIIAIHKFFDLDKDKLLFDVGHQAYTHKILTGRADKFDKMGEIDGISKFLSTSESKYDVFESGHSSTSISTAMGMALARDNNKEKYEIISFIGDASIANGVAFEALNNLKNQNHKVIIILNDNDMAINKSIGAVARSFSKIRSSRTYAKAKSGFKKVFNFAPRFIDFMSRFIHRLVLIFRSDNIFDNFEISYLGPIDGHNFKALEKAFRKAKNYPNSILVHVKTKKGYGYEKAEQDETGKYHGIGPFDLESGDIINKNDNITTFTSLASKVIYQKLQEDNDAYLICPAMVYSSNLDNCFNDFKDRCVDVGIAEEHAVSLANGLAINGKKPYVFMYSTFMQRAYDEINHDVTRVNSNVTFFVDRAGIVGKDGKTHQGIFDVSFIYPLGNSVITMVSEGKYLKPLLDCLDKHSGPKFIRYQKQNTLDETYDKKIEFGKFIKEIYKDDNKTTIIATGNSCYKLKQLIIGNNYNINLINPIFIKPLDYELLDKIKDHNIIVYDNTSTYDGLCSYIVKYYNQINKKIDYYCIDNIYVRHGSYDDVLKDLKLDEKTILDLVINKYGKD